MRLLLFVAVFVLSASTDLYGQEGSALVTNLRGNGSVPPSGSQGSGWVGTDVGGAGNGVDSCHVALQETVDVYVLYSNLEGTPTGAYIHLGREGETGPRLFTLLEGFVPPDSSYQVIFDPKDCEALADGGAYAVITTDAHPSGEIRGQTSWKWFANPVFNGSWGGVKARYR